MDAQFRCPLHGSLLRIMDEYYHVENKPDYATETFRIFNGVNGSRVDKIKILYVTFLKYPNTGGLSNYITSLKTGFAKQGHEVDVISPLQMSAEHFEKKIPEEAQYVRGFLQQRYDLTNEKIIKNVSFLNVFTSFLKDQHLERYDVLHAQDLFSAFILGQLNLEYRKPLFFTPHGHFTKSRVKFDKIQKGSIEEVYFSEIEKRGIQASNKIITISNSFHSPLKEYGAENEQLITVHTGIDFKEFTIDKKPRKEKIIISCVARLSPRKGHDILLRALSQMKAVLSNVEVWIVGAGVMDTALEEQVQLLGLKGIKFLGKRTDIPEILSCSDIYVLPTINDNFPLSIIEAMFSGKAIITTDCGGIREMIQNGRTGIICEPGNVQQLSGALALLLRDKRLRAYLGKSAKEYARNHFTQEIMVSQIERIYRSSLQNNE